MITTWGNNVGILQEGESYKLSGLSVRTYCNKKFLSIPNFTVAVANDIGEVVDYGEVEKERKMTGVVILDIKFFEVYSDSCKGKVTPTTDKLGDCSRCGTTQRLDRTKVMASVKNGLRIRWCNKKPIMFFSKFRRNLPV